MSRFMVKSEYHANGKVTTELFLESEIETVEIIESGSIYYDYFNEQCEADDFIEECKTA